MVKKSKKKKSSDHSVLNEALGDISKELTKLKKNKVSLVRKLSDFEKEIINTQNRESELRDKISRLVAKESQLNKSKEVSQSKVLNLKEKIAKIKKI